MGIADRDYHRTDRREGGGFFSQVTPVVKWLLIANLGIYFLDLFLKGYPLRNFGAFTIQSAVFEFRAWEFVTFQFLHGSLGHVFFNCIGIFFFGPFLERWWGAKKFLVYYLLCGVAGAVFFTLLVFIGLLGDSLQTPLVGASAGIYGILVGVAVIAPNLRVALLFPPIELSMRQLAIALMVISGGAILLKIGGNEGGEAGLLDQDRRGGDDDDDVAASLSIKLPAECIILEAGMTAVNLATSNHGSVALEIHSAAIADDAVTPAAINAASDVFKMECMVSSQYASVCKTGFII